MRVLNESPEQPTESRSVDDVPAWAMAALADRSAEGTIIERLTTALTEALVLAYPGSGIVASGSDGTVTVVWHGGPTAMDVLTTVDLAWAFEDRGAWIATVDDADPDVWPVGEVVSFVFRRREA